MNIVYVIKDVKDILRYSLRSIGHIEHDRLIVVGANPEWMRGHEHIHVPDDLGSKGLNTQRKLLIAIGRMQENEEVMLMTDDTLIAPGFTPEGITGTGKSLSEHFGAMYAKRGKPDGYTNMLRTTSAIIGWDAPFCGSHFPQVFSVGKLRPILQQLVSTGVNCELGTVYAFLSGTMPVIRGNAKVDSMEKALTTKLPVISTTDKLEEDGDFMEWIKSIYKGPSTYESPAGDAVNLSPEPPLAPDALAVAAPLGIRIAFDGDKVSGGDLLDDADVAKPAETAVPETGNIAGTDLPDLAATIPNDL